MRSSDLNKSLKKKEIDSEKQNKIKIKAAYDLALKVSIQKSQNILNNKKINNVKTQK